MPPTKPHSAVSKQNDQPFQRNILTKVIRLCPAKDIRSPCRDFLNEIVTSELTGIRFRNMQHLPINAIFKKKCDQELVKDITKLDRISVEPNPRPIDCHHAYLTTRKIKRKLMDPLIGDDGMNTGHAKLSDKYEKYGCSLIDFGVVNVMLRLLMYDMLLTESGSVNDSNNNGRSNNTSSDNNMNHGKNSKNSIEGHGPSKPGSTTSGNHSKKPVTSHFPKMKSCIITILHLLLIVKKDAIQKHLVSDMSLRNTLFESFVHEESHNAADSLLQRFWGEWSDKVSGQLETFPDLSRLVTRMKYYMLGRFCEHLCKMTDGDYQSVLLDTPNFLHQMTNALTRNRNKDVRVSTLVGFNELLCGKHCNEVSSGLQFSTQCIVNMTEMFPT